MDVEAYRFRAFIAFSKKVDELNANPEETATFGLT